MKTSNEVKELTFEEMKKFTRRVYSPAAAKMIIAKMDELKRLGLID